MIAEVICSVSLTCTVVSDIDLPFKYIGKPYDTSRSCYVQGTFYKQCPGPPTFEDYKLI